MQIKLQKQTAHNGCVAACLAMLLDRPVSDVTVEFNRKYHEYLIDPVEYAAQHGLKLKHPEPGLLMHLPFAKVYILAVPSLNTPGMMHAVVCDCRDTSNIRVLDPASGQQYCSLTEYWGEPGTTRLVSWMIMYEVVL